MGISTENTGRANYQSIGLILGPAVCALMLITGGDQQWMPDVAWRVASVGLWMAIWWATEAVPVAVTAFLPIVVFEPLGITSLREAVGRYAHPTIYLFLGAFVLALGVEKSNLHRRVALWILSRTGTDGRRLILGFMIVAALLSMWMTNTSTTMMMLPIATSVATLIGAQASVATDQDRHNFQVALMLALAYSTTMGGLSTLVGTPPNVLLAGFLEETYNMEIGFFDWMMIGVPLSALLLPLGWFVLTRWVFPFQIPANAETRALIDDMAADLGPPSQAEIRVALVFLTVVLLWMTRRFIADSLGLDWLSDAGIVMAAALLLFVIPSEGLHSEPLMRWEDASKLPWGVLVLFGGGLSLAAQVANSGLAEWLGNGLSPVAAAGILIAAFASAGLVVFLTELTSNLATTATFLPVIAAIATSVGMDPLVLCVPVTLAASCAFMLPVATPPNAIVFASGLIRIPDMVRAGLVMNLIALALITMVSVWLVPAVLGV